MKKIIQKHLIKTLFLFNLIFYSFILYEYNNTPPEPTLVNYTVKKPLNFLKENINKKPVDYINVIIFYERSGTASTSIEYKLKDNITTYKTDLQDSVALNDVYRILDNKIYNTKIHGETFRESFISRYSFILKPIFDFLSTLLVLLTIIFIFIMIEKKILSKGKYDILEPENILGGWDDLIGMEDIKKEVKTIQPVLEKTLKDSANISLKTNMIFSGPPGTGKTKLASLLAKEMKLPIIIASAADLETGFVNGGVKTLKTITNLASKHKKCIIFLDEAQDLFRPRQGARKYDDDTQNALLAIIDGVRTKNNIDSHIIWILASNFDDNNALVDQAMMRRFPFKLNFRLPNKDERITIFQHYLNQLPKEILSDIDHQYLGEITSRMSPALIENIVSKSYLNALQENTLIDTKLVIKNYEKEILGTTSEHQEGMNEQKKIIATHELGHFIVDYHFLLEKHKNHEEIQKHCNLLKISIENINKIGALGFVLNKDSDVLLHGRTALEQEICKLYGGHAAEEVFFGNENITSGAHNDIQKITNILKQMILEVPMYKNSKINYTMLDPDIKQNSIQEIEKKSEELYDKTIEIISMNRELISFLLPTLLEKNTLNSKELFEEINKYKNNFTN